MRSLSSIFAIVLLVLSVSLFAHEGHELPGVLPTAPHGGKVQEATHGKHELFYEVVFQDKALKVYPLRLNADNSSFIPVASKALSKVALKVELPRQKAAKSLKFVHSEEKIESAFDAKGLNRFIVVVSSVYHGESKSAKIQLEIN